MKYRYIIVKINKCAGCGHTWLHSDIWQRDGEGYSLECSAKGDVKYKLVGEFTHKNCFSCCVGLPTMQEFQESGGFQKLNNSDDQDILDLLGDI